MSESMEGNVIIVEDDENGVSENEEIHEEEENQDYIVEKVVAKRYKDDQLQYMIKWLNFPESDNTWEPLENIYCKNLIEEYEEELKKKSKDEIAKRHILTAVRRTDSKTKKSEDEISRFENQLSNIQESLITISQPLVETSETIFKISQPTIDVSQPSTSTQNVSEPIIISDDSEDSSAMSDTEDNITNKKEFVRTTEGPLSTDEMKLILSLPPKFLHIYGLNVVKILGVVNVENQLAYFVVYNNGQRDLISSENMEKYFPSISVQYLMGRMQAQKAAQLERKFCFVPYCKSNASDTPKKAFITVPMEVKKRVAWFKAAKRTYNNVRSILHACEDHFNIKEDAENYEMFKAVRDPIVLKPGVLPHKFDCQRGKYVDNNSLLQAALLQDKNKNIQNQPSTSNASNLQAVTFIQQLPNVEVKVGSQKVPINAVPSATAVNNLKAVTITHKPKSVNNPQLSTSGLITGALVIPDMKTINVSSTSAASNLQAVSLTQGIQNLDIRAQPQPSTSRTISVPLQNIIILPPNITVASPTRPQF